MIVGSFAEVEGKWGMAYTQNEELRACVQQALGDVTPQEASEYIQTHIWKALCEHVHGGMSAAQLVSESGDIVLPELPGKDRSLLRCILTSYNYPVAADP